MPPLETAAAQAIQTIPITVGVDSITFNVDFVPPAGNDFLSEPFCQCDHLKRDHSYDRLDADDLSGVQHSSGNLHRHITQSYWTGSGWTASQTWITTTTANPWFYTIPSIALVSGNLYYLRAQFTDVAGNVFATVDYHVHLRHASTERDDFTSPVANGFYSNILVSTPFAGTSADNGTNATGVSTVTLTLQDLTTTAVIFTSSAAAGSPASWTYTPINGYVTNHQ